jgi:hypothetical protein
MGLLDDAIREHLELKRRRGADPAEVARAQREALDPVSDRACSADPELSTEEHSLEAQVATEGAGFASEAREPAAHATATEDAPSSELSVDTRHVDGGEEHATLEETAELDMNSVLEDEHQTGEHEEQVHGGSAEWDEPLRERGADAHDQGRLHFEQRRSDASGLGG